MDAPADTVNYLIAGYAFIFVVLSAYIASLVVRFRNLHRDEALLRDVEDKS